MVWNYQPNQNYMLVSSKDLFERCYGRYGIAAVNVWDMEQLHGLFSAAQKANAPFIVQTTPAARTYADPDMLISMISAASRIYPKTVFAIHLDHGNKEHAFESIESGDYTSVMIDASHESFEKNVSITKNVVDMAHKKDIAVEAELGVLSGVEDDLIVKEKYERYTRPAEVEEFVKQTACDSSPAQFDPIVPGLSYMEAFGEFMLEKFELLKSSGKAKQKHHIS